MTREILDLFQVQHGIESAWGTPGAFTRKAPNITSVTFNPNDKIEPIQSLQGLAPAYDVVKLLRQHGIQVGFNFSLDQLGYYMANCFGQPVTTGVGPYVHTWNIAQNTQITPRPETIYYGTATAGFKLAGAIGTGLDVQFGTGELAQGSVQYVGKAITTATPQALSDVVDTVLAGHDVSIYIDSWGGTVGTTLVENTVYSAQLKAGANFNVDHALGSLDAIDYLHTRMEGSLSLSLSYPGASNVTQTLVNEILGDDTPGRQFRLLVARGTSQLQVDFAGKIMGNPNLFGNRNGAATIDFDVSGVYNPTLGNWIVIELTNNIADYTV